MSGDWGIWRERHAINNSGKLLYQCEWDQAEQEVPDEFGGIYKVLETKRYASQYEAESVAKLKNLMSASWEYTARKIEG